jgi:hypothetical protein
MRVPKFGAQLTRLRGIRSRPEVCRALEAYGVRLSPTTLLYYERGKIGAPDPVVLWALGRVYQQESLDEMFTALALERTGRDRRNPPADLKAPRFTAIQVRVAEWFASFDPGLQQAIIALFEAVALGEQAAARRRRSPPSKSKVA